MEVLNVALWAAQGWLAAIFLGVGLMKLTTPRTTLQKRQGMGYAADRTDAEIKVIGLVEVLGAIGLILPWLIQILPVLTPLAALGLAAAMAGAVATHHRRNEPVVVPALLLVLVLFVAAGRSGILG